VNITPDAKTRRAIKFWLDCLQIVTVFLAVAVAGIQWHEFNVERAERARIQDQQARDQLAATKRELERPYQERKLAIYLDAARVLAHLAASPNVEKQRTEARFWELYWGELAFVESQTADEKVGEPSVEHLMVTFCEAYFDPGRCSTANAGRDSRTGQRTPIEAAAIELALQASKEIRDRAAQVGK